MWQRFTDHARRIIFVAQEEAGKLGENYVSTEHLLLALVRDPGCGAALALTAMGRKLEDIRSEVMSLVTRGDGCLGQDMQLAPRAKIVIDQAYNEAREMGSDQICSEHLLLGVLREGEGVGARVLHKLGVEIEAARKVVREQLTGKIMEGHVVKGEEPPSRLVGLKGKDLLDIAGLTRAQIDAIFDMTGRLKNCVIPSSRQRGILEGKTLAMIFEKPSLRTRVSFETGIFQLGGHGIYLHRRTLPWASVRA